MNELALKIEQNTSAISKLALPDEREQKIINKVPQNVVVGRKTKGSLNAFNVTTVANTPLRITEDVQFVNTVTLLADSANTVSVTVGLGTPNGINSTVPTYPLVAGASISIKHVIPSNIFVSSADSGQVLHVIYGED